MQNVSGLIALNMNPTLQCLGHDFGNEFTPELRRKLAEAEERREKGDVISIRKKEGLDAYLGSLK